jgi:hypothetical protein
MLFLLAHPLLRRENLMQPACFQSYPSVCYLPICHLLSTICNLQSAVFHLGESYPHLLFDSRSKLPRRKKQIYLQGPVPASRKCSYGTNPWRMRRRSVQSQSEIRHQELALHYPASCMAPALLVSAPNRRCAYSHFGYIIFSNAATATAAATGELKTGGLETGDLETGD